MRLGNHITGIVLLTALNVAAVQAAVIDPMDNTDHFSAPFNAASVIDNGNGTVTLTKTAGANIDSGIIWSDLGAAKIDLADSQVTIVPAVPDEDFININAIYFDASDNFVNQALVWPDSNQETPFNFDVSSGAGSGAVSYVLQIRILPFEAAEASYTFDSIQAVPEPASMLLLGAGSLCLLRRKRLL